MSRWVLEVPTLYGLLDERRVARGLSWSALSRELGFSVMVFSRMASGRAPSSVNLGVMLLWLGWAPELALIVRESAPSDGVA